MTDPFAIRKPISPHKKNSLDKSKSYKLTNWIDTHKEQLDKVTQPNIAKLAEKHLGFPVTVSNIFGASNALGLKLGQRATRVDPNKDTSRTIARHLVALYGLLAEPVPDSLREIANR